MRACVYVCVCVRLTLKNCRKMWRNFTVNLFWFCWVVIFSFKLLAFKKHQPELIRFFTSTILWKSQYIIEFIDADIARSGCETSAVTANVGQPSDAVAIESSDRTSISDQTATTTINFRRDYIAEQCTACLQDRGLRTECTAKITVT